MHTSQLWSCVLVVIRPLLNALQVITTTSLNYGGELMGIELVGILGVKQRARLTIAVNQVLVCATEFAIMLCGWCM